MKIRFTLAEAQFLTHQAFVPLGMKVQLSAGCEVDIDENEATRLRDECSHLLMRVGFGANDEPTEQGLLIEDLIDKLFVQ